VSHQCTEYGIPDLTLQAPPFAIFQLSAYCPQLEDWRLHQVFPFITHMGLFQRDLDLLPSSRTHLRLVDADGLPEGFVTIVNGFHLLHKIGGVL
jgi:hypothetical protein